MTEPQIQLYKNTNFEGRAVTLTTCGSGNLGVGYNFNDQTSSIRVVSGIWLVYGGANYSGACYVLTPGEYPAPDSWNGNNDKLSAARPLPGNPGERVIMLFEDVNYGGRMVSFTESMKDFNDIAFNDTASSAIVQGDSWYLYKDADFKGTTWPVGPTTGPNHDGYIPQAGSLFGNDAVSSIKAT